MDEVIFLWFNSFAGIDPLLDGLILFFAKYHIYVMAAGVVAVYLVIATPRLTRGRRSQPEGIALPSTQRLERSARNHWLPMAALVFISAVIARFGVTELIRLFYDQPRPFEIVEGARQLIEHSGGGSFPSGHAAFAFALAAATSFYDQRLGIFFWVSAILIGLSRIAAGVHWPSDILGGAIVGIGTARLLYFIFKRFLSKN